MAFKSFLLYVLPRWILGLFFVVVSVENLLSPSANFLYVIQQYDIFPPFLERLAAETVPWAEFFLGVFLTAGLWLRPVLLAFCALVSGFILILGQAILRQLPLNDCGCFGELLSFPLHVTIIVDFTMLGVLLWLVAHPRQTSFLSLDHYFERQNL